MLVSCALSTACVQNAYIFDAELFKWKKISIRSNQLPEKFFVIVLNLLVELFRDGVK